jgi:hypothetical protein
VRRFGHVVSCLGWGTHALAPLSFRAATYSGVFTLLPLLTGEGREHHGEILREATRLAEGGKIVPRLDQRHFTLKTIDNAYQALKTGSAAGKIVVDVDLQLLPENKKQDLRERNNGPSATHLFNLHWIAVLAGDKPCICKWVTPSCPISFFSFSP